MKRISVERVPRGAGELAIRRHQPQAVARVARQLRIDEMPGDASGVGTRSPGALQSRLRQPRRLVAAEDVEAFRR